MSDNFFKKFLRSASGRILLLKKKLNAETFRRLQLLLLGLAQRLSQAGKKLLQKGKSLWLALLAWLRTKINKETLHSWYTQAVTGARHLLRQLTWENIRRALVSFPGWISRVYPEKILIPALCVILLTISGNPGTLAWYTDQDSARNTFVTGKMDLFVEYQKDGMSEYREMTEYSALFNDQALYEPGYTQVVYFRIYNRGDIPFQYQFMVNEVKGGTIDSVSVLGNDLHLPDYLRFGIIVAETQLELDRELARVQADQDMEVCHINTYPENSNLILNPGPTPHYAALIVYMPTYIGNEANYDRANGAPQPQVTLGVTVYAQQENTPMP